MASPLRILMVSDVYYPHPGGISEHIYHLSLELIRKGHSVTVMAPHMAGEEDSADCPPVSRVGRAVPTFSNLSRSQIALSLDIKKQVKEVIHRGFDIIHIHNFVPTLPLLALRYSDCKNVITVHAAYDSSFAYQISKRSLKKYFEKLHARIAVSGVAENSLAMFFPGEYEIIPNGIDLERFSPDVKPLPELKDGFNVLFVGRFEPRKGLGYLLKAYPTIKRTIPEARLVIVGSGGFEVPRKYSNDIILRKRVPPLLIPRYYRSADVFCSPATGNESFGIVLLEAMACGVPVVASSIPGYRCVIKDGENGLLTENRNPESIASAIIKLANDKRMGYRLGKSGRLFATRFSWDIISDKIESVYRSLF